jgi:ureidoglycolate lyase
MVPQPMVPQPLVPQPLTAEAYAPYGRVIAVPAASDAGRSANQGTARKVQRLAAIENRRGAGAPLDVAVFRCRPRRDWPMDVAILEKHPESTQVFIPMNARRFLVVVALGGDAPDLGTLAAFVASGTQAISYHPGVWHHPMIALDAETDFVCLVHEDGTASDCVEHPLAAGARPRIVAPS